MCTPSLSLTATVWTHYYLLHVVKAERSLLTVIGMRHGVRLGLTTVGHDAINKYRDPDPMSRRMTGAAPTIFVIDDDLVIREALGDLVRSVGLQATLLASVPEFLTTGRPAGPTCLVLDVRLHEYSGLDFQRELGLAGIHLPIVFITGYGDIRMAVQAMKAGAIDFLTKPLRDQELLDAIQLGLAEDRAWLKTEKCLEVLRRRYQILTPQQREIMRLVTAGRSNRQIASDIGVSEITIKMHRREVMRTMRAASLPELARMAERLRLAGKEPQAQRSTR
jgi:FixJ family two-component response regulator